MNVSENFEESLRELLWGEKKEEKEKMKEIFTSRIFVKGFKVKNEEVINYFKANGEEILKYIIYEEDEGSNKLFRLLVDSDGTFFQVLSEEDLIYKHFKEVFEVGNRKESEQNKVLCLFQRMLQLEGFEVKPFPNILKRLILESYKPFIFSFLDSVLVEANSSTSEILRRSKFEGIIRKVLEDIRKIPSSSEGLVLDRVDSLRLGIYQIIARSASNVNMSWGFRSAEFVQLLGSQREDLPSYVRSSQWAGIRMLVNRSNAKGIASIIPTAIKNVLELEESEHVKGYQVSSISFLTQLIVYEPNLSNTMINIPEIFEKLCRVVWKFPNSSLLHFAFRGFTEATLRIGGIGEVISEKVFSFFIPKVRKNDNRVLKASINDIFIKIIELGGRRSSIKESLRGVEEFPSYALGELRKYKKVVEAEYGQEPDSALLRLLKSLFA